MDSPHKGPLMREEFSCHDVIMELGSGHIHKVVASLSKGFGDIRQSEIPYFDYIDVIMTAMASQITSLTVVSSTVYSDADQNIKAPRHWPSWRGQFSPQSSWKTLHSSPVRARYGVSFVSSKYDQVLPQLLQCCIQYDFFYWTAL